MKREYFEEIYYFIMQSKRLYCAILHSHHKWESISFMWKIFTFWDPLNKKKRFLQKCLSVYCIFYRSRKSKNKFVKYKYTTGQNCGTTCFSMISKIILISILWVMKFLLLIMWKPSKLSLKLVWNEVVSLNFEEVIAEIVKISMLS